MLATSSNHPLAKYDSITLGQLSKHDILLLDEGHCLRAQALEVCYLAGNQEQIGFQATSLETLRQMVIMNIGITLFPILAIIPPIATPKSIKFIPFRDSIPKREIAIVWRKRSSLSPFLSKFAKAFESITPLISEYESAIFSKKQQDQNI